MPRRHLLFITALLATIACADAQIGSPVLSASDLAFRAFPEADTVRHIARDVDRAARREIERRLPFRIHFEELGEHRLHVAFRGPKPVGLLYTRSEETEWGLTEIGWAMSLEGKVLGFEFASSRSRTAGALASSAFAESLVGRSFDGLVELHARREARPAPSGEPKASPTDQLSRTVLRSALKATVITSVVWHDEVAKLADLAMLFEEFPGATDARRRVAGLPHRADAPRQVRSVRHMEARGRGGFTLGSVTRATVSFRTVEVELRWVLDASGTITLIRPAASWPDDELRHACSALRGHRLAAEELPDTPLTAAARELAKALLLLREGRGAK